MNDRHPYARPTGIKFIPELRLAEPVLTHLTQNQKSGASRSLAQSPLSLKYEEELGSDHLGN